MTGKLKFFKVARGYGFIACDDGSGDVFLHRTDLPAGFAEAVLVEGAALTFELEKTRRGRRAVNIALASS